MKSSSVTVILLVFNIIHKLSLFVILAAGLLDPQKTPSNLPDEFDWRISKKSVLQLSDSGRLKFKNANVKEFPFAA